jgi:hypothetical protein
MTSFCIGVLRNPNAPGVYPLGSLGRLMEEDLQMSNNLNIIIVTMDKLDRMSSDVLYQFVYEVQPVYYGGPEIVNLA